MSRIQRIVSAIDSYTMWAFNPQHHLRQHR
jgi:hypothetical protein